MNNETSYRKFTSIRWNEKLIPVSDVSHTTQQVRHANSCYTPLCSSPADSKVASRIVCRYHACYSCGLPSLQSSCLKNLKKLQKNEHGPYFYYHCISCDHIWESRSWDHRMSRSSTLLLCWWNIAFINLDTNRENLLIKPNQSCSETWNARSPSNFRRTFSFVPVTLNGLNTPFSQQGFTFIIARKHEVFGSCQQF